MPQTILITGAVGGIGRDAAFALAKRGYRVVATTRTAEQAEALRKDAETHGVALETRKLDISKAEDVAFAETLAPDILINNAAQGETGPLAEIPMERMRRMYDVNVFGTLAMIQAASKAMLARKQGRIITVTSVAGKIAVTYMGPYSSTKFALEGMHDALRTEMKPRGVFVSMIEPGLIRTGFNERMADTKYTWWSASSPFANDMPQMKKSDAALPSNSHPTDTVVAAILHAVESPKPRARYVAPKSYRFMVFLSQIAPAWLRDRVVRRYLGL